MNKKTFIIIYTLIFIGTLYFIDSVLELDYFFKVLIKLSFIFFSIILGKFYKVNFDFLKFKTLKTYKLGVWLSIFTFLVIFLGFFIVKNFIDLDALKSDFLIKYNLGGIKFFIASFYLVFINSFIEEYYFRGFIYKNIDEKKFAHIFSSISFAIYHLSNFQNWFDNIFILIIPLAGLIIAGLLFNYLTSKSKDIYNSYIPHMFADLSIIIIGYFLIIR